VADPSDSAYRIGIEDELQISVWREPELSLGVVVRPDGMITLPLLSDIPVTGLTTTQLGDLLTERLKSFVNEPQVTVIVRSIHSRRVYLVGEAARQGAYSLNGRLTIMELLAQAGGMAPFAKTSKIYVLRRVNGKPVQIPFNYKRAIVGRVDKDDIVLLPGDIVVVP
jgi:polysaccharide export outer membrane protein